jgi:hypothetical protein
MGASYAGKISMKKQEGVMESLNHSFKDLF